MSQSKLKHLIYALITVIITVNCFVFYCLSIENGGMSINVIKAAYSTTTWVLPIPIVLIEFVLALICSLFIASPLAMKITFNIVDPKKDRPFIVETIIVCSTVFIMCPLMSFLATILYTVIPMGKVTLDFIPIFLQTVVINFPFALLSQLFFIQPLVRKIMSLIFKKEA